jgi:prophage tail gpP-like protein
MLVNLFGKQKNELTITVEGYEIPITSARLLKTMDTCADACTAVMPWNPGKNFHTDNATIPYSYSECGIYIGGVLQSIMTLYNVTHRSNATGTTKELEMFSKTADLIDSTVFPPYEVNNMKFTDRCKQMCYPFGIDVILGEDIDKLLNETKRIITKYRTDLDIIDYRYNALKLIPIQDGFFSKSPTKSKLVTDEKKFPRITAHQTDKIFDHLAKLGAERGILLSCTRDGNLLLTRANTNSKSVGTIEESSPYGMNPVSGDISEYVGAFKGRERWQAYRAIVKSAGHGRGSYAVMAHDEVVPYPRILTFNADSDVPGNAKSAAEWRKNKAISDAMNIKFPVSSWYAPSKILWKPNTVITIKSKTLGFEDGFDLMINQVEFQYENNGAKAVLSIKPKEAYTGKEMGEPWLG